MGKATLYTVDGNQNLKVTDSGTSLPEHLHIQQPLSDWKCEMFGMSDGVVVRPLEGNVPNWFWRMMQYLFFGNKWTRESE